MPVRRSICLRAAPRTAYGHAQAWSRACRSGEIDPDPNGLVAGFGPSLVDRAVIDGLCRALERSFPHALRENLFGLDLGEGLSDASFDTAARRDHARRWTVEQEAPVLLIEVESAEETVLERLAKRQAEGSSASDAGPDFYATSAARFEPPGEWPRETHLQLRTDSANWRDEAIRAFWKSYTPNLEAAATSES